MKTRQITAQLNPIHKVSIDLTELTPRELQLLTDRLHDIVHASHLFGELTDELRSTASQISAFNELTNK